jgi:hypothetical protein
VPVGDPDQPAYLRMIGRHLFRRVWRWAPLSLCLMLAACATTSSEESKIRMLLWDAATGCARSSAALTITDVDHYGRVWYSLAQGGQQDVPAWEACYHERTREAFSKSPELVKYYQEKIAPRR